jgi:hypothetical protein
MINKLDVSKLVLAGTFGVDSGQAMIGDPCYLDTWQPWNSEEMNFEDHNLVQGEYGYLGACNATLTKGYGTLGAANAVVMSTGYGDGLYPVYVKLTDDGRVAMAVIDFTGELEDEEQY